MALITVERWEAGAYRPAQRLVTNVERGGDEARLRETLERYSPRAVEFVKRLIPRYAPGLGIDYASFRPVEEQGRDPSEPRVWVGR